MVQFGMRKTKAIVLLGGSIAAAAHAIGISYQAVKQWPDELPPRIADRVLASIARKHLPELVEDDALERPTATGQAQEAANA